MNGGRPTPSPILLVGDASSVHVRRLASGLTAAGLRIEVAGFQGDPIGGVTLHRLGTLPANVDARYALAIPSLARLIVARRPRVVHAHYVSSYGLMAAGATRMASFLRRHVPLVQTAWGTDLLVTARANPARRLMAALALRSADVITGDSDDLIEEARSLAPSTPVAEFVFGPPEELVSGEREARPVIVSSRRLDPDMRVDLVVRAYELARRSRPEVMERWRLVVAGSGSDEARVRAAAGGDPTVEFTRHLSQPELHRRLLASSVLVSVPRSDATSAALLEGLAAGLVPIVNDLPANRQWVDETIGVVVSMDPSEDELAEAIVAVTRCQSGDPAPRERVRPVTWERQLRTLAAMYDRVSELGNQQSV